MGMRDAHDWFADLGGGTRVALVVAGSFRSDAGVLLGGVPRTRWHPIVQDEIDDATAELRRVSPSSHGCLLSGEQPHDVQ